MQHQIVFLDRESVGANVRKPEFPHSYTEYEATWTPEEILERLKDATIAIIILPAARAPRLRPGASSCAPRSRNGTPTP